MTSVYILWLSNPTLMQRICGAKTAEK